MSNRSESPSVRYRKLRTNSERDESPADCTRSKIKQQTHVQDEQIQTPQETVKITEKQTDKPKTTDDTRVVQETHKIVREKQATEKMDRKTIQENINSTIKEFNYDGTHNVENELVRFLDMADMLYETLNTEEEKLIFNKLIKFKLNGEAYSRISHRDITNYDEFKETLRSMFLPAYSLSELERRCTQTTQKYGESVSNFGYRLIEALEEYKQGYKTKYGLKRIDDAYSKHLDFNTVQTFKKGLNNTILKEKIATIKVDNVRKIIEETMEIERMLATSVDSPTQINPEVTNTKRLKVDSKPNVVICNYCQTPNHTWDVCRTRLLTEIRNQNQVINRYNQYTPNPRQHFYSKQPDTWNTKPSFPQRYQPASPNRYRGQNNNFTTPQGNTYESRQRPIKYCSFCKTTIGHTFDECRSKFLRRARYSPTDQQTRQPPKPDELEEQFKQLKINSLNAQMLNRNQQQENSTGSNQM